MSTDVETLRDYVDDLRVPPTPGQVRTGYVWIVGITWALFQLYAGIRFVNILTLVHVHVLTAISISFALNPTPSRYVTRWGARVLDTGLSLLPMVILAYMLSIQTRIMERIPHVDPLTTPDMVVSVLTILLLLEATRRVMGLVLPAIGVVFILYGFLGHNLPALIAHSGLGLESMLDLLIIEDSGIYGLPAKISARYVYLFILFGAVLLQSGAGDLFLDLAKSVAGGLKGGPAKMAVIASGLMATINGSAVANTVSTGSITIPLMQRTGYDDESAGAIEALASTGGQYMPPVMGAAAFILAELAGYPYLDVIIYAAIPATLYYVGVMSSVHFVAVKRDVDSLPEAEIPSSREKLADSIHLAVPIVGLLYILYTTGSVERAAAMTVILTLAVILVRHSTRMGIDGYLTSLRRASEMVLSSALPTAIAGIIIGVVFYAGVATRIVGIVLSLSGGQLVATLILIALASIALGMGMPTSGAYITVAILAVPALVELGIPKISAHLFGLYFSVISMVTPPIALAAFAAASVSGGDTWKTGIKAFKLGLPVYLIPFLFIFHPALLTLESTPLEIAAWTIVAALLMVVMSAVGVGHMFREMHVVERAAAGVGGLVVVFFPQYQLVGAALVAVGLLNQFRATFDRFRNRVAERT